MLLMHDKHSCLGGKMNGLYDLIKNDLMDAGPFAQVQMDVMDQLAGQSLLVLHAGLTADDEVAIDEVWLPNQLVFQLGLFERECVLLWPCSRHTKALLFLV